MGSMLLALTTASIGTLLITSPAGAEPARCQKMLLKSGTVLAQKASTRLARCLDKDNAGKVPGPCPDPITAAKLAIVRQKVERKIATACEIADATALGFSSSCSFVPLDGAAESACGALPLNTPAELATCITCRQRADLFELVALLYASHAVDVCGGTVGTGSSVCSQGGCASMLDPVPDQRDLGRTAEGDCQQGIAKAAIKYLLKRSKLLGTCALVGTRESCLANPSMQLKLARADAKRAATIARACDNRHPVSNRPFCCRTTGNSCMASGDPAACVSSGGQVQEDKVCAANNRCDPVPGGQIITWWSRCPRRDCNDFGVATVADLGACVRDKADETVDGILCSRFPTRWPCPSSPMAAFLGP
jgi:hypothetical protein